MNSSHDPNKLAYSIKEFCASASIGRTKVYELISSGQLSTVKLGSKTLILASEAERFVGEL